MNMLKMRNNLCNFYGIWDGEMEKIPTETAKIFFMQLKVHMKKILANLAIFFGPEIIQNSEGFSKMVNYALEILENCPKFGHLVVRINFLRFSTPQNRTNS